MALHKMPLMVVRLTHFQPELHAHHVILLGQPQTTLARGIALARVTSKERLVDEGTLPGEQLGEGTLPGEQLGSRGVAAMSSIAFVRPDGTRRRLQLQVVRIQQAGPPRVPSAQNLQELAAGDLAAAHNKSGDAASSKSSDSGNVPAVSLT